MEPVYSAFEDVEKILLNEEGNLIRLIFTRHGRTYLNDEQRFQPWTPDGDRLNKEGRDSACNLGKRLNRIPIRKIYSSDWHRTIHTAQLINEEREFPLREILITRGLRDFNFGELCGVKATDVDHLHPDLSETRMNRLHMFKVPGGDSFPDFHNKKKGELERILYDNNMGNILIVSHSYVTKCLIISALDLPLEKYANKINIKNTSISIVELEGRQIPGRLLLLNNI